MTETIQDQTPAQAPVQTSPLEGAAPTPEPLTPPAPESPEYTATQKLWQKLLEVGTHALIEEGKDVVESRSKVAKTFGELFSRITKNPINIPGHIHETDAFLRGRDPGDLKMWAGRNLLHVTLGTVATGVDYLDTLLTSGLELGGGPVGVAIGNGIEYITDTVISIGTNELSQRTTGINDARYPSDLSESISTVLNFIPFGKNFINSVNIEASFRLLASTPISGAAVERMYVLGNKFLDKLSDDKRAAWIRGLVFAMSRGYLKKHYEAKGAPKPKV